MWDDHMKQAILLASLVFSPAALYAESFHCPDHTTLRDGMCQPGGAGSARISSPHQTFISPLGKNLLVNSQFTNKLANWKAHARSGWEANQGVLNSGALVIHAEIPPEDKYIHETTVEQCVRLGPGDKFQLKAQFRAEQVLTGKYAEKAKFANRANVIWYESTDCSTGGQYGGYIEPENILGWQSLVGGHWRPAFKAKAAKITLVQKGRYSRGHKGYWDNVSFAATELLDEPGKELELANPEYTLAINENYVSNGTFSKDLASWRAWRANWSATGNEAFGSAKVSLASEKTGFGTGVLDQCVNIGRNTKFELGASVKKDKLSTQTGGGRIRISWNAQENCKGRSKTDVKWADISKTLDGWEDLKVTGLLAPSGTHSVHIELIQSIAGPGRFSVYWDDVYFKAIK